MSSGAARPRDRAIALVLALVLPLAGCHTWSAPDGSPASVVREREPEQVRVTLSDGTVVRLRRPSLRGDSLVGEAVLGGDTTTRSAVALADIEAIEVRKTHALGTASAATLGTLGVLVALAVIVCLAGRSDNSLDPC